MSDRLNFTVISTSQRTGSNSRRVAEHTAAMLRLREDLGAVHSFDLGETPLPLFVPGNKSAVEVFAPIQQALEMSDGLVVVTPEWNGMASPAAKNLMHYAGAGLVGHKAGLLISVSTGMGGSYPIADMRVASNKNNRLCWTPDHVIFRQCEEGLGALDEQGADANHPAVKRLGYGVRVFAAYAQALRGVRASGVIDHEAFANGL